MACPLCGGSLTFEGQHQMGGLPTATEWDCPACRVEYIFHDGTFAFAQRFGLGGKVDLADVQKAAI